MNLKKTIILIFLFFVVLSCSDKKIVKVDKKDRIKEIDEFYQKIAKKREKIKTIQIEAKADTFNGKKRIRGKLMMSMTRPDKLRIDTLSPFEQPVSSMLVSENKLYFYNFDEKKLYYGVANINNLSMFLPVRMSLKSFIDLLSGIFPLIAYKKHKFKYIEDKAEYELTLISDDTLQIVRYRAFDLQIVEVELFQKKKKTIYVRFADFKTKSGITYAKRIYFDDIKNNSKLKLIITDIIYNEDIDETVYSPIDWKYEKEELN